MRNVTITEIRLFLKDYLNRTVKANAHIAFEDLPDDCDLLLSGMIDSIGLLELMEALRTFCGADIDFEALGAEEMTIVGPLCRFLSQQTQPG